MTRFDLALAIMAVLLVALASGWVLHWLWSRLARHREEGGDHPMHEMAERLHEAEIARDAAERRLAEAEESARTAIAERQAELESAMETIGALRRQLAEWQAAYDALQESNPAD